jgi:hypothetical protein
MIAYDTDPMDYAGAGYIYSCADDLVTATVDHASIQTLVNEVYSIIYQYTSVDGPIVNYDVESAGLWQFDTDTYSELAAEWIAFSTTVWTKY